MIIDDLKKILKLKHIGLDMYAARCPFHDEKTPSFNIRSEKGYYKCFGCGRSGRIDDLVELLSDRKAKLKEKTTKR